MTEEQIKSEFEKIKNNLSPESKAILEGNVSDYTSFNTAPIQADINQLTALINKANKEAGFGGKDNAPSSAAISQGTVVNGLSEVEKYRDTLQAALGHANFEKKKAASNNPPEEKAPERKEPDFNIDKYSGPAANVDVDNLVNGLSHADGVGYAKSTLDGTEDTLKDTGDDHKRSDCTESRILEVDELKSVWCLSKNLEHWKNETDNYKSHTDQVQV